MKVSNFKEKLNRTLEILFPKDFKCFLCSNEVDESENCLCNACENSNIFCDKVCERCGTPVKSEAKYCLICLNHKREFDFARSPMKYEGNVISAVHAFKFDGKTFLAEKFAKVMIKSFNELKEKVGNFDYLIAVPLHKKRLKERGYNQALLIAKEISVLTNVPVLEDVVIKTKATPSQRNFSRKERIENVKDSFKVVDKDKILKGKNILIVDDVLTTGATTEAISEKLKKAKANKICVLTFARADVEKDIK